jgi:Bacterial membrane protein YfhO
VNRYAGGPAAYLVLPEADGLRLVHAEDTAIYERTAAQPRIRWASGAIVEPAAGRRLELLADHTVPASTVVLSERGPRASGQQASIEVVEASGDTVRATVVAEGDNYLVVADAIQRGWGAEVDGEAAELRAADPGVVAVAVPAGTHDVRLAYVPRVGRRGSGSPC